MKDKLSILFFCVLGALVVLLGRISFINFHSGEKYKKQVLSQAQQKYENRTMPAKRGSIYDRNGNVLATSNKVYNVILDCKAVNTNSDYMEPTVNALVTVSFESSPVIIDTGILANNPFALKYSNTSNPFTFGIFKSNSMATIF